MQCKVIKCYMIISVVVLLVVSGCVGSSEKTVKEKPAQNKTARESDIGLKVEEYVEEYNSVAESRHSVLKLSIIGHETEKGSKRRI